MADAASGGGGTGARQLATLAGVAVAAGAVAAVASYWLLRVTDHQRHADEPDAAQQQAGAGGSQDAAAGPPQQQGQAGRKRRPAPAPLRSPFHNGRPQASDASTDRCWEWLSRSEDGAPEGLGPSDPSVRLGVPTAQVLRRHRQAEQQRHREQQAAAAQQQQHPQQQQQQQQAGDRRRAVVSATRVPSATVSDPLGISTPPQRDCRSGSLPSLPPEFDVPGAATAASAPLPAAAAAGADVSNTGEAPAEAVLPPGTEQGGGSEAAGGEVGCDGARAVSWGPAIRNLAQPAALCTSPAGSADLDSGPPTLHRQRTVAEALTTPSLKTDSTRTPSGKSEGDQGTVALDELRLFHRPDGSPLILGKGNFGTVYNAQFRGDLVAVKVFPIGNRSKDEESFRKEIALLRKCVDEHIVGFRAACLDAPGHLLMAMELMQKGDLRTALHDDAADGHLLWYSRNGSQQRTPGLGKQIAVDIARGLQFLHERHIVHLDLKSPNVLLTADNHAKIGDVGLARFMPNDYMSAQAAIGAFVWSAPEVLMGAAKCSNKVDIYSFGVILWELVTGDSPQRGRMRAIKVPEECPPGVADLVNACMERDASIRPSAAEIVQLLSGDPAALERRRAAHASTDSVFGNAAEEAVLDDERMRLQQLYNNCNYCIYGGPEQAAAAGYTEPALESVVEGIRPFDGKSYSYMIEQLQGVLQSPDIEDLSSGPRQRLEDLMRVFRPVYGLKLKMSWRVFQELKHTDVARLGELVDQLSAGRQGSGDADGEGDGGGGGGGGDADIAQDADAAADPASAAAEQELEQSADDSVRRPSKGSSRSNSTRASDRGTSRSGRSGGGGNEVDEYAANKDTAWRAPPDMALWNRVLDEMRLTPEQLEAYAEARLRVGARLQHLQSERSALVAKLQALSDPQDVEMYEQAAAAATELRTNMRLEAQANHMFQVYLMMDLLQPIQYARAECCAWPAMFDASEVGLVALERCRRMTGCDDADS